MSQSVLFDLALFSEGYGKNRPFFPRGRRKLGLFPRGVIVSALSSFFSEGLNFRRPHP